MRRGVGEKATSQIFYDYDYFDYSSSSSFSDNKKKNG
jgi:hypothetical protein